MDTKFSTNRTFGRMLANILSIVVMLAMAFPVTGAAYAEGSSPPKVGLIVTTTGIDDNSFNEMAYQGLLRAANDLGVDISTYEPQAQSEYDSLMQQCADENQLCIVVGFEFRFSLPTIARANPEIKWGIIDWSYPDCWEGAVEGVDCGSFTEIPNIRGLRFNEKQAGYLAGVLAGAMTTSNVVGAVGGMEVPPVVAFLEGYRNGAQCTNPAVNVLTTYTGTFSEPGLGATTAQEMIGQGADVIFGAAGSTGDGAITSSAQNGQWAIGVDVDQYLTVFGNGTVAGSDKMLSSAMKRVDNAVYQTIADFTNGAFASGTILYDLATDGVGLAAFHETDGSIPDAVKDELDAVQQGIINGTVNIDYSCAPPRVYANLPEDSVRFEYSAPGALVNFSIYDSPGGNLLWEGSRTADDSGFVYLSIWEHRVDLNPGIYIVASDDRFTNQLLVEPVSLDVFDPVENILQGKASPWRSVWVVANNESVFCGTRIEADSDGDWIVDFDDYECEVTEDMWAYAQVMDAEDDTSEAVLDFIEGYHDYDAGDVPNWACNAGGWAVDTDDRERDLTIRILADGNEVASTIAGKPREDLLGACGADGSCGFELSLWGLITPYEAHEIMTQAYDEETAQWFDLYNSPRTLTCRTYDIYAYDPLSGEIKQITNLPDTGEYDPSWSPNGKKVAHDVVTDDSHGIYVTDVKTGVSTPLIGADNGGNDASWSPNGKWIAFDRRWYGDPNVYVVPAAGGEPILVRENAVNANWAPNGKRIVFQDDTDGSIRTVPVDGGLGGETFITEFGGLPAWSPDGNWIAYSRDGDIWKVQVNVQGRVLDEPIQLTSNPFNDGKPTWSPDSQTIIYDSGFGQDYDIWSIPAAGGMPTWLTGAPMFGEFGPANARNSSTIAFAGFSPDVQAARSWVSAYTYDAGTWSEGGHNYHLEAVWNGGSEITPEVAFNVSNEAPMYDGYVLLRGLALRANIAGECPALDPPNIRSDQPTLFHNGYVTDYPMTYAGALAYFDSLSARALWDTSEPVDLQRHEIIPYRAEEWPAYMCSFTTP